MMALIVISCEETDELQNDPTGTSHVLNAKITKAESRAVWDTQPLSWDGSDMANSRTYAKPEGNGQDFYNQYWSVGDAISYFNTTHNSIYVSTKIDRNKDEYTTYFEQLSNAPGEALNTPYYYGVYPYKGDTKIATDGTVTFTFPEEQVYCEDSYANGANGMIARHKSEDQVLEFLNFCSYLQLQLTTTSDSIARKDIDRIVLKANNKEDLISGVGTITFNAEGYPEVTMDHKGSNNHIILNCKNQTINLDSAATKFWFVLPGNTTFTEGFNITVSFSDGTYFHKSTNSSISSITIERNHIKPLAKLPIKNEEILTSIIRYKLNPDPNPGSEASKFLEGSTFFTDVAGNPLTPHTVYNTVTGEYEVTFDGHLHTIKPNAFHASAQPDIDYIIFENSTAISIEESSFYMCTADSIIINNDISYIGKKAFEDCTVNKIIIEGDIHEIRDQAFRYAENLESLTIKGNVDYITESSFRGSEISSLYIYGRVIEIEALAFDGHEELEEIYIPYVEHIGDEAFQDCEALTTIDLHGVHIIGVDAFKKCKALESVCISRECKTISEGAFLGCNQLKNIYLYAEEPPTLEFDTGTDNPYIFELTATIHIPQGSLEKYAADKNWLFYINRKQVIADITPEQIKEHFGENAHENL